MSALRRLRRTPALRALVRETRLDARKFVLPLFASEEASGAEFDEALPALARHDPASAAMVAKHAAALGIPAVLVFGTTERKDDNDAAAWDPHGPAQATIGEIKAAVPEIAVFADTCLCSYTTSGHCGVVRDGDIDNDATVAALCEVAVSQARAGADVVAPSDMMDGRVARIRRALDESGFADRGICSYSAKLASSFYGPFRAAAGCAPRFGDRRTYQIDPATRRQARRSIDRDLEEGADLVLVKPALAALDLIRDAREQTDAPIGAFNVSGEYAMVKTAARAGLLDEVAAVLEILTAIARAGADFIITYHALEAAQWLGESDA